MILKYNIFTFWFIYNFACSCGNKFVLKTTYVDMISVTKSKCGNGNRKKHSFVSITIVRETWVAGTTFFSARKCMCFLLSAIKLCYTIAIYFILSNTPFIVFYFTQQRNKKEFWEIVILKINKKLRKIERYKWLCILYISILVILKVQDSEEFSKLSCHTKSKQKKKGFVSGIKTGY